MTAARTGMPSACFTRTASFLCMTQAWSQTNQQVTLLKNVGCATYLTLAWRGVWSRHWRRNTAGSKASDLVVVGITLLRVTRWQGNGCNKWWPSWLMGLSSLTMKAGKKLLLEWTCWKLSSHMAARLHRYWSTQADGFSVENLFPCMKADRLFRWLPGWSITGSVSEHKSEFGNSYQSAK